MLGAAGATPEQAAAFEAELKKRTDAVAAFREEHKDELKAGNRKFRDELTAAGEEGGAMAGRRRPAAPPRAMVLVDLPNPVTPHVLPARQPQQPRRGSAAAVRGSAGRRQAAAVQGRQRPAGTGPGHRQQGQPADGPRDGQPRLAAPFRRGTGAHAQRLRRSAANRRRTRSCSTGWPRRSWRRAGRSRRCTG